MQNVLEILSWYKNNSRDLPWRTSEDPYRIWLSEVILQQTQVVQGTKYYHKFISEYPDINTLASADEQEVLKNWQGLGYYSRARNLLRTARIVSEDYKGVFPNDYKTVLSLPGIGDYTASAILSFAFKMPYPTLDGNVYRVLSRLHNIHLPINDPKNKTVFMDILNQMIIGHDPSLFNNAMMELGAMVCKPDNPRCNHCPVSVECLARKSNTIELLPVKTKKIKRRKRYFHFFYILYKNGFYFEKRGAGDIWQHLYQPPLIESSTLLNEEDLQLSIQNELLFNPEFDIKGHQYFKHILTHQDIHAQFTQLLMHKKPQFKKPGMVFVNSQNHLKYPVPVLVEKFLLSL